MSHSKYRLRRVSFLALFLAFCGIGCSSASNPASSGNGGLLRGTYEGVPTFSGTGYEKEQFYQYYRFRPDGTFSWFGIQPIDPSKITDTGVRWYQWAIYEGRYAETSDSVKLFGIQLIESTLSPTGALDVSAPESESDKNMNKAYFFLDLTPEGFRTSTVGGGGTGTTSWTYTMTFRRIGGVDAVVPRRYLSP